MGQIPRSIERISSLYPFWELTYRSDPVGGFSCFMTQTTWTHVT